MSALLQPILRHSVSYDQQGEADHGEADDEGVEGVWARAFTHNDHQNQHPYARLSAALEGVAALTWLEEATGGVPKPYLAAGLAVLTAAACVAAAGIALFCNALLVAYPAVMTLKTLEGEYPLHTDRAHWLRYWVVHGALHAAEAPLTTALAKSHQYHFLKLAFMLWCAVPAGRLGGAECVYGALLRPALRRHERALSRAFRGVHDAGLQAGADVARASAEYVTQEVARRVVAKK